MLHRNQSTTYVEGRNQGHRKINFGDKNNQPHLTDKSVVEREGIGQCFSDESLKITTTTSTVLSIDSDEEISTDDVLSTIQKMDTDSISKADFDYYGKREQHELSVSEVASERLYSHAAERRMRTTILTGNDPTDPIRIRNGTASTVSFSNKNSAHPKKSRSTTNTKGKPSATHKSETYATAGMKGKIYFQPTFTSNGKRTTKNAFFDRMSKTETYATADMKGKIAGKAPPQPKFTTYYNLKKDASFDRKSKIEICTTSDMKGKSIQNDEKTPYENSTDNKRTTNAFFNRMSKTETYATADMKGKIEGKTPPQPKFTTYYNLKKDAFLDRKSKIEICTTSDMKGKSISNNEKTPYENSTDNKRTTNAFFNRMSKTETYATSTLKGPVSRFYNPKMIYG